MRLWDLLIVVALGLVSWGAYVLTPGAGFIVAGVALVGAWFLFDEVKKGSG